MPEIRNPNPNHGSGETLVVCPLSHHRHFCGDNSGEYCEASVALADHHRHNSDQQFFFGGGGDGKGEEPEILTLIASLPPMTLEPSLIKTMVAGQAFVAAAGQGLSGAPHTKTGNHPEQKKKDAG